MAKKFEQLSTSPGFMKNNGGLFFRKVSKTKYEFKTTITKKHLNRSRIAHGGYIASIIDAGAGTGAHRSVDSVPVVTVALDIKFIGPTKVGDKIIGFVKIQKITKSLVFLICHLKSNKKIITTASGVWKILNKKPSAKLGFGG